MEQHPADEKENQQNFRFGYGAKVQILFLPERGPCYAEQINSESQIDQRVRHIHPPLKNPASRSEDEGIHKLRKLSRMASRLLHLPHGNAGGIAPLRQEFSRIKANEIPLGILEFSNRCLHSLLGIQNGLLSVVAGIPEKADVSAVVPAVFSLRLLHSHGKISRRRNAFRHFLNSCCPCRSKIHRALRALGKDNEHDAKQHRAQGQSSRRVPCCLPGACSSRGSSVFGGCSAFGGCISDRIPGGCNAFRGCSTGDSLPGFSTHCCPYRIHQKNQDHGDQRHVAIGFQQRCRSDADPGPDNVAKPSSVQISDLQKKCRTLHRKGPQVRINKGCKDIIEPAAH